MRLRSDSPSALQRPRARSIDGAAAEADFVAVGVAIDRLWLQMLVIAAICLGAGFSSGVGLVGTLVMTALLLPVVYVLARLILRRQHRP